MKECINLKAIRKEKGLTQKEFSKLIGISRSYYSDLENGYKNPSYKVMLKINKITPIFFNKNDADRKDG